MYSRPVGPFGSRRAYEPRSVVISLERGPCYGTCPVYRVTLYGDGTVRYDGKEHVRVKGTHTAVISPEKVKALIDEIDRSGFFTLRDAYTEVSVTDAPTASIYAATGVSRKEVRHYRGDFKAPGILEAIENRIDEAAGVSRWTAIAAATPGGTALSKEIAVPVTPKSNAVDETAVPGTAAAAGSVIGLETERRKIALRRTVATSLRDEAYALQQKGQLRDAVIRYRRSLVYWPDTGLESYIVPLEQKAGFSAMQYRPEAAQAVQAKPAAGGQTLVYATVRNRSTQDITLLVRGEPPEAATLVRAGEILIRPVRISPSGEVTFQASRNGQPLATRSWSGNPKSSSVVPAVLYDDKLNDRLNLMTGLK